MEEVAGPRTAGVHTAAAGAIASAEGGGGGGEGPAPALPDANRAISHLWP